METIATWFYLILFAIGIAVFVAVAWLIAPLVRLAMRS